MTSMRRSTASWLPAAVWRGRRLTARMALVLDPEPDGDRERVDFRFIHRLRDLEPAKRVSQPHRDAELARELLRKSGEPGAAAGHDDLADGEAVGLRLVVGQRGDELADERLDAALKRRDSGGRLLGRELLRRLTAVERKLALDVLDLRLAHAE